MLAMLISELIKLLATFFVTCLPAVTFYVALLQIFDLISYVLDVKNQFVFESFMNREF